MDFCLFKLECARLKKNGRQKEEWLVTGAIRNPAGVTAKMLPGEFVSFFSSHLLGELILLFAPFHALAPKCFPIPCSPPPLFTPFSPLQFSWVPVSRPFTLLTTIHLHTPHLPFLYTNASRSSFLPIHDLLYFMQHYFHRPITQKCSVPVSVMAISLSLSLSDVLHLSAGPFKSKQRSLIKLPDVIHIFYSLKFSH